MNATLQVLEGAPASRPPTGGTHTVALALRWGKVAGERVRIIPGALIQPPREYTTMRHIEIKLANGSTIKVTAQYESSDVPPGLTDASDRVLALLPTTHEDLARAPRILGTTD